MPAPTLTQAQAHALFDILTHWELYAEIESFKYPDPISNYGPPFTVDGEKTPSAPLLQLLVSKFGTTLPGLRDVSPDFWQERCRTLLKELGDAELSESYDKGSVGLRRTLSCAGSVVLEYPARGCLGGFSATNDEDREEYDPNKTEDILLAWDEFCHRLIHGDMLDQVIDKAKETDKIEDHPTIVQAAHEFIVINFASLLYHILVLSPDGPYLVKIIDNLHKLIPYAVIRQTLRVGNAATMINGMVRLILAKLSVGSITNWVGLSQGADEGMNLLQSIISQVLLWDVSDMRKQAAKIEKSKDGPSKEHLNFIKEYIPKSREEHEAARSKSKEESKSMIASIFERQGLSTDLTAEQHYQAARYLALNLSIRDREQIEKILCRRSPDLLTQAIRDVVAAYDPMIRSIHNAADLSGSLWDLQVFLDDLLKIAKTTRRDKRGSGDEQEGRSRSRTRQASMEDFVALAKKHQGSCHKFLHQVAKNGPEVTEWFREYLKQSLGEFRKTGPSFENGGNESDKPKTHGAGAMTPDLEKLLEKLSEEDQKTVLGELDAYSKYLFRLQKLSSEKMRTVIAKKQRTSQGPGIFLARWKALMDDTLLTPAKKEGLVRSGYAKGESTTDLDEEAISGGLRAVGISKDVKESEVGGVPAVESVVRLMGVPFRELLVKNYSPRTG